ANAARQQVLRKRAREGVYRALGGGIIQQTARPEQTRLRTGVDDRAAFPEVRQRRARHVEVTGDVGLQGFLQMLLRQVFQLVAMHLERLTEEHLQETLQT